MHTETHDYDYQESAGYGDYYEELDEAQIPVEEEEHEWNEHAPPSWTVARVVLLLLVLILIAAVIVFVAVPYVDQLFAPEPLPLRPPVNT